MAKIIFPILLFLLLLGHLGASPAIVVLPDAPAPEEQKAAEELARYWKKMTGEAVEIVGEKEAGRRAWPRGPALQHHRFGAWRPRPRDTEQPLLFYVGETVAAQRRVPLRADLDRDGFLLRGNRNRLFLRGASSAGTRFAVARFLHEYGGLRWYLPTELGEHVPAWGKKRLPPIRRLEEPEFLSRQWSNATRFTEKDWEDRNLLGHRDRFHHNAYRLFTEEVYELRPDFFIMLGEERVRPDDALGGRNYQICFGNPDAAVFAARKAAEFFDANPGEMSFSLGMNDTRPICQCRDCQQWVEPGKTFREVPDYSDLLFTFMNRAAEELSQTHPDKYLGTLAYYWAENVPSFPVHPQVIPYLTADRSQWHDEAFRETDRDLMRRWARAGPERIGIYDYYYGAGFVIPRPFTSITTDSLRHASQEGIDGFYAEIYSNWSLDGPKAWLASQLLWDIAQDPEELLEDYYGTFFGEAARPMRAFFDRAEEIWMSQGEPVFWLKFYFDFTQLELFPPKVCTELRGHLSEAAELADSDLIRERVALVSEGFRQTELYSELYHGVKSGDAAEDHRARPDATGEPASPGESIIARIERAIADRLAVDDHYEKVIHPNVLHRPTHRLEEKARFLPGMKLNDVVGRLASLGAREDGGLALQRERHGPEGQTLQRERHGPEGQTLQGERHGPEGQTQRERMPSMGADLIERIAAAFPESRPALVIEIEEAIARGEVADVLQNGSFRLDELFVEPGDDHLLPVDHTPLGWKRWGGEIGRTVMALSDETASNGSLSLVVRGATREALYQGFDAAPGDRYLFLADAKGLVSAGSLVEIRLRWFAEDGQEIHEPFLSIDPLLPGDHPAWTRLSVYAEAPSGVAAGLASLVVHHQAGSDVVFFDQVRLMKVGREK